MNHLFSFVLCFLVVNGLLAQSSPQQKHLKAMRIQENMSIDGKLSESVWEKAEPAQEFIERFPQPGTTSNFRSVVKVLYDDNALYIGATLYDANPDSILKELGNRDAGENNADLFGVVLDTYLDKQNAFEFMVSASSVQTDARISQHDPDFSWNAVWANQCKITQEGWVVEMKIPYSAIRFSDKPVQTWGINFYRTVRRTRQRSFWNEVNPKTEGYVNQFGILDGIENVKPPFRLMFFPYISSYLQHDGETNKWSPNFRGGADVKLGLNESFTLDMTLIPDFGQVQTDNVVYNLTPFEVKFQDYRPFFTEGVELFNKSENLFYSRRIGGRPMEKDFLSYGDKDSLLSNPATTQLVNASKISGRTAKNLGVGFLNAITAPTYAVIQDKETSDKTKVLTDPLTNYNMLVLDQPFWGNSYATLINTNVMRSADFRDANVTGAMFKFADKKNSYAVLPNFYLSYIKDPRYLGTNKPKVGYSYDVTAGKFNGKHQFNIRQSEISDKYDCNDLGYLSNNSESKATAFYQYSQLSPKGYLNTGRASLYAEVSRFFRADKRYFSALKLHSSGFFYLKNFIALGFEGEYYPFNARDYFSPRVLRDSAPLYANLTRGFWHHFWVSTDYRKKLAVDAAGGTFHATVPFQIADTSDKIFSFFYWNNAMIRYRFNDKFTLRYDWNGEWNTKEINWATEADGNPVYGKRNTRGITHILNATYNFTRRMSLSCRARHYHLGVKYDYYLDLLKDGNYRYRPNHSSNEDFNYNAFTVDFLYAWEFTAGSLLTINWKQQIYQYGAENFIAYPRSFRSTFDQSGLNAFSVKVMYFLDAQNLKRKKVV
ncbi:MAG: DUF5916 domain-containing protein [Bacteroidia bacterium]